MKIRIIKSVFCPWLGGICEPGTELDVSDAIAIRAIRACFAEKIEQVETATLEGSEDAKPKSSKNKRTNSVRKRRGGKRAPENRSQ